MPPTSGPARTIRPARHRCRRRPSSGRGFSFHDQFFNPWDPATEAALVDHRIVGGRQCDARGYDQAHPEAGAVLNHQYVLPH